LLGAAEPLGELKHDIAFIGDIGVGKTTAISFVFDLLVPPDAEAENINRPMMETGGGRTTMCDVHIKSGPEFGISVMPMDDAELIDVVSDFCAGKWARIHGSDGRRPTGSPARYRVQRAIRNMSGLTPRWVSIDGKRTHHDPIENLVQQCHDENDFPARVFDAINLSQRTTTDIWLKHRTSTYPWEWMRQVFISVNNGRMAGVPLPKTISLTIPGFAKSFGDFETTVVDTKTDEDFTIREDLDARLNDPRTAIVICSRFHQMVSTRPKALLRHIKEACSEPFGTGKVLMMSLPHCGEATGMEDDEGNRAATDDEGNELMRMTVRDGLADKAMEGIPVVFFNARRDDAAEVTAELYRHLARIRDALSSRVYNLCAAANEVIEDRDEDATRGAILEVGRRLRRFLHENERLGPSERHAYEEALSTLRRVDPTTLWAMTQRSGEYDGLNVVHQVSVGAAKDASLRSRD